MNIRLSVCCCRVWTNGMWQVRS